MRCLQDVKTSCFMVLTKYVLIRLQYTQSNLISEIAKEFGTQCCVVEVQASVWEFQVGRLSLNTGEKMRTLVRFCGLSKRQI